MNTYRLFSPGMRLCHWVIAACIIVLFLTGLYIGNPSFIGTQGKEPVFAVTALFSMETIRHIHFAAAAIFGVTLLVRFYLFSTYRGNRLFPNFRKREYWRGMVEMIAYYIFLRRHHRPYLRNPLAGTTYLVMYVLMAAEAITGLAMYTMIRPNSFLAGIFGPVNGLLGNEYMTHVVHHIIAWIFIVFLIIHVYLVFFNDIVEKCGELSSIVSGRKSFNEQPVDANDSLLVKPDSLE